MYAAEPVLPSAEETNLMAAEYVRQNGVVLRAYRNVTDSVEVYILKAHGNQSPRLAIIERGMLPNARSFEVVYLESEERGLTT